MLTSWWTGSLQHFNINEIIYRDESVHPGFWKGVLSGFQVVAEVRICPYGQLRRSGLNFNEINTSRNRRLLCIQQAWQELLWRSLARILVLLRLFLWRTGCGRMNGSDFGWKCRWKSGKIYGIPEKSVLRCTKKHHTNGLYSVEANYFVNGNPFI